MANRKNPRAALVARQATDLAVAAPQVVAHRLTRMAMAGANPSARDRREFTRMVSENRQPSSNPGRRWACSPWLPARP